MPEAEPKRKAIDLKNIILMLNIFTIAAILFIISCFSTPRYLGVNGETIIWLLFTGFFGGVAGLPFYGFYYMTTIIDYNRIQLTVVLVGTIVFSLLSLIPLYDIFIGSAAKQDPKGLIAVFFVLPMFYGVGIFSVMGINHVIGKVTNKKTK